MKVGLQIKMLRESKNMSREILADKLHLSPNTLYKIEVGERVPSLEDLKIISEEFKVDPSIFFACIIRKQTYYELKILRCWAHKPILVLAVVYYTSALKLSWSIHPLCLLSSHDDVFMNNAG